MKRRRAPAAPPVYIMTDVLGVCSDFTGWCKVSCRRPSFIHPWSIFVCVSFLLFFKFVHVTDWQPLGLWTSSSKTAVASVTRSFRPVIHIHVRHRLSPPQLLRSPRMTQFLFIIIVRPPPAWIDYPRATLCPQFDSFARRRRNIASEKREIKVVCWKTSLVKED